MSLTDILMIFAVLTGPIIAVRLTRYLDAQREVRERKLLIFKTLMATRAYNVSWAHVEALNRIDLEFDKRRPKERAVIEAWKEYHDLLGNQSISPDQWAVRRVDLIVEVLHKMALVLEYDFDKTHIKNSSYSPRIHGETEATNAELRKGLIDLLNGKREIPMRVTNFPNQ